jgi:hypothetical protein
MAASSSDWPLSSVAALEDSSALAAFRCVIRSISPSARVTC